LTFIRLNGVASQKIERTVQENNVSGVVTETILNWGDLFSRVHYKKIIPHT
jgi:hypothetical protein